MNIRTAWSAGCIAVLGLAAWAAASWSQQEPKTPAPDIVRVAACQIFCIDSDRDGNLRRVEYAVREAAKQGAHIACFPETADLGWINPEAHTLAHTIPGPTTDRVAELARQHNIMICIGLCEKDGDALYDAAVLIDADGKLLATHRKVNVMSNLMDPPYTAGTIEEATVVETRLGRIGMLICADTFKNELVEHVGSQNPDLLLVPYGWAARKEQWPDHGKNLGAWVSATARRTNSPVVGVDLVGSISTGPWKGMTYGGQSPVASADGTILGTLKDRDAEVRTFDIRIDD